MKTFGKVALIVFVLYVALLGGWRIHRLVMCATSWQLG